jgi:hypothetical protein
VKFVKPTPISANTMYVAFYHMNVGHYANDDLYFATTGVDNAPLHALDNASSSGNGVYTYTGNPAFPGIASNSKNYWIDVVFQPTM